MYRSDEGKKDERGAEQRGHFELFEIIAPVYGLFFDRQKRHYQRVVGNLKDEIDLRGLKTAVDFGCGTGALCDVLANLGLSVTGVDPSENMLRVARRKAGKTIRFVNADALVGLPFADQSFDAAFASYVLHGLKAPDREAMLTEMKRLARRIVVIFDYNGHRSWPTDLIERLERGDYFNFIQHINEELNRHFGSVRVIGVGKRAAAYLCVP
jgi:ubiquinone/menaquinone biosynthesis C-methylase UbiE